MRERPDYELENERDARDCEESMDDKGPVWVESMMCGEVTKWAVRSASKYLSNDTYWYTVPDPECSPGWLAVHGWDSKRDAQAAAAREGEAPQ